MKINPLKDILNITKVGSFTTNTFLSLTAIVVGGSYFKRFKPEKESKYYSEVMRLWGSISLKYINIGLNVEFEDRNLIDGNDQNFIFLANHSSLLDILAIAATSPKPLRFVAKSSLFKIPYFGPIIKKMEIFPIDRSNREEAFKTLDVVSERLEHGELSIGMFPEGTRSKDGKLQPFKKGAFYLAIDTEKPIVPISITNSRDLLPYGSWKAKKGTITLHYGKPIETKGLKKEDIPKLIDRVKKAIEKNI